MPKCPKIEDNDLIMNKYNYTYLITYPDGMVYHGSRGCDCPIEEDDYMGSSKYTPDGGTKIILTTHNSRENAFEEEIRYHSENNVKNNSDYYNKSNAISSGFSMGNHSEESKIKISEATIGSNNPFFGKKHSDEVKAKISKIHKGKVMSEKTKEKMRANHYQPDNSGENNGMFGKVAVNRDNTLYVWFHDIHGEVVATMYDLVEKYELNRVDKIKNGFIKKHKGWSFVGVKSDKL